MTEIGGLICWQQMARHEAVIHKQHMLGHFNGFKGQTSYTNQKQSHDNYVKIVTDILTKEILTIPATFHKIFDSSTM